MSVNHLALWLPPKSQHNEWREFVGSESTREAYESGIFTAKKNTEADGFKVIIIDMDVSEMAELLDSQGWENSPQNRASVVELRAVGEL